MTGPTTPERPETPDERAEREAREAAERLAARAAELAAMDDATLYCEATDEELRGERDRITRDRRRLTTRGITTTPRSTAHGRIDAARGAAADAARAALVTAARGASKPDGPGVDDLGRALALDQLASAPASFWAKLHAVVDAPMPPGMGEVFADGDPAGERRAADRALEDRLLGISAELEARAVARRAAQHPGMAARIAALAKGAKT